MPTVRDIAKRKLQGKVALGFGVHHSAAVPHQC